MITAAFSKKITWVKQLQLLVICNSFPLAGGPLRFRGPHNCGCCGVLNTALFLYTNKIFSARGVR